MDSRCSRHISGKASLFSEIKEKCNDSITLCDKGKCKILGIDKVGKDSSIAIDNIYLVDGLKFNLLSVSQLCDRGSPNTGDIFITSLRLYNVCA